MLLRQLLLVSGGGAAPLVGARQPQLRLLAAAAREQQRFGFAAFTTRPTAANDEEARARQTKKELEPLGKEMASWPPLDTSTQLRFYGLFKQAIFGDAVGARPIGNPVHGAKFDAWKALKGTSKVWRIIKMFHFFL